LTAPRLTPETRAILASVLIAVAALGYLAGHRGAAQSSAGGAGSSPEASRVVSAADVLLAVPPRWQRAPSAPAIPGLQLEGELAIAPANVADAGLVAGQLPAGQAGPLPAAFLNALHSVPHTEVLSFLGGQAYEYSELRVPGFAPTLDLYVVPTAGEGTGATLLACYATPGSRALLAQCRQIVAKLTLVGQSQDDLNPDPQYAARLGGLVRSLDAQRLALRRRMGATATPPAMGALARTLAADLARAAASLSRLEAPIAAGAAQAALGAAILGARQAYADMAAAASAERLSSYDLALVRVERADAGIDAALESIALLGYGGSQR
jgi:hypothetical protein